MIVIHELIPIMDYKGFRNRVKREFAKNKYLRYSHLISDIAGDEGEKELLDFAITVGLNQKWEQKEGRYDCHFDIFGQAMHDKMILFGAKLVSLKEIAQILKRKREIMNRRD